ncbi:MAG: hypothetical protein WD512_14255 [Candidatus Paceibacterota bacterium]
MIPLLLLPLPLLIKEKVEFYYYRQVWLNKIKKINQQYGKQITIEDVGAYTILFWDNNIFIWDLEDRSPIGFRQLHQSHNIYNYKYATSKSYYSVGKIPHKYHYSSGLNNPSGYK